MDVMHALAETGISQVTTAKKSLGLNSFLSTAHGAGVACHSDYRPIVPIRGLG